MELRGCRRTLPKYPNAKGSEAVPDYVYLQAVKAMSSLFLLGGVPGLASCQPSREPNDSFDPIRIGAKSTLCSLRAGTCQLTTRPPWIRPCVPSSLAQRAPRSPAITKHNHMWENTLLSQRWLKTLCMRQGRVMCSKCAVMFKVTTLLLKQDGQAARSDGKGFPFCTGTERGNDVRHDILPSCFLLHALECFFCRHWLRQSHLFARNSSYSAWRGEILISKGG